MSIFSPTVGRVLVELMGERTPPRRPLPRRRPGDAPARPGRRPA